MLPDLPLQPLQDPAMARGAKEAGGGEEGQGVQGGQEGEGAAGDEQAAPGHHPQPGGGQGACLLQHRDWGQDWGADHHLCR